MKSYTNIVSSVAAAALAGSSSAATVIAQYSLAGNSNDSSGNSFNGVDTDIAYVADIMRGTVASFNGTAWRLADDPQWGPHDRSQGGSFWPAFGDAMFLTDWVDSEESQAILDYQRRTADHYFEEVSAELGAARHLMKVIGPALTPVVLAHSRHHALVEGKKPRVPDAYRAITTARRALRAAKSYF